MVLFEKDGTAVLKRQVKEGNPVFSEDYTVPKQRFDNVLFPVF